MQLDTTTMKRTSITALCGCLIALLILGSAAVSAARGIGIKAGEGRMHPAIDLDFIFDTNPGYFPSDNAALAYDLMLRIRPGITLSFPCYHHPHRVSLESREELSL